MQKNEKYKKSSLGEFSNLDIFILGFLTFLFYCQSSREILLDRGIITVLAPLILILIISGVITAWFLKFFSIKILTLLFGLLMSIGWIFLFIPDENIMNSESFPIYNIGIYFLFGSITPLIICLFCIVNVKDSMLNGKKSFLNSARLLLISLLIGLCYNWWLRSVQLAENQLLNLTLGIIGIILITKISTALWITSRLNEKENKNANLKSIFLRNENIKKNLVQSEHNGRDASFILISIPAMLYLILPMSFAELYSYMAGISKNIIVLIFILGVFFGIILSNLDLFNENGFLMYKKILPILCTLTTFLFGLNSFLPPNQPIYIIIYLIASISSSSIFLIILKEVVRKKFYEIEKIIMIVLILFNLGFILIKLLTIERYIPYLDMMIGLMFTIPSFWVYRSKREKGGGSK